MSKIDFTECNADKPPGMIPPSAIRFTSRVGGLRRSGLMILAMTLSAQAQTHYTITNLGNLGGRNLFPYAISSSGAVVGSEIVTAQQAAVSFHILRDCVGDAPRVEASCASAGNRLQGRTVVGVAHDRTCL